MGGRKTYLFIITPFVSVIFLLLLTNTCRAAPDHIVINQIQITGGEGHTTNDFVELFNPTASAFNLKGYRLVKRTSTGTSDTTLKSWTDDAIIPAYGFYLWANSDYTSILLTPDSATSGTMADNNGLALRQGAADTGVIIDSIAWGNSTNAFVEGTVFSTNPSANQTLERKKSTMGSRQDTNNNAEDFLIQTAPTLHHSASAAETPSNSNSTGTYPISSTYTAQVGDVLINEIMSDPGSNSEEWIELYNNSNKTINLSGFTLEDGSHTLTQLNGNLDTNSRFLVVGSLKSNLNNDGDIVILKSSGVIIDQVTYGNWNDGNMADNAPVARMPLTIGRVPDGKNTNNNQTDFVITNPTAGSANQPADATKTTNENKSTGLIFSEIYPNPPLSDDQDEFIELFNSNDLAIDLKNWQIKDSITTYTINVQDYLSTIIEPKRYFILPRPKTGLALDNDGSEQLTLSSFDNKTIIKLSYTGPAPEGAGYALDEHGKWQWSSVITPGQTNQITLLDSPPHLGFSIPKRGLIGELVTFDASDTVDPEGKAINVLWDFGDGTTSTTITPSHIYNKTGRYTIKLKAFDQVNNEAGDSQTITIENNNSLIGRVAGAISGPLELSEIMPNPQGSDANEWFEIYNPNDTTVSTSGWQIQINNHNYKLSALEIQPETYYVINKKEVNFSLPNKKTSLALIKPTGEKTNQLEYDNVKEGSSYAWGNNTWQWTSEPTPGSENIITQTDTNDDHQIVSLAEARLLDSGSKVITEGTITLATNFLAKNLIFLGPEGLQINLSDNNWPNLKIGDVVKISGSISRTTTGTKLLVRKSDQLVILSSGQTIEPIKLALTDITEDNEGQLITASGKITKSTARSFTISADNTNLAVSLKNSELGWPKLNVGAEVNLTGFVTLTKDGLKLFVRSPEDIVIKSNHLPPAETIDLSQKQETNNWLGYLLVTVTSAGLALMYFWQKFNWPKPLNLITKFIKK